MRILKDLLALLFPPRDPTEVWADRMASVRPVSTAEMRTLLERVKSDQARADRLLAMWDTAYPVVGSGAAWRMVWNSIDGR